MVVSDLEPLAVDAVARSDSGGISPAAHHVGVEHEFCRFLPGIAGLMFSQSLLCVARCFAKLDVFARGTGDEVHFPNAVDFTLVNGGAFYSHTSTNTPYLIASSVCSCRAFFGR